MATRITLVCDLHEDGDVPAVGTETFTFGGETYEIDLCEEHRERFRVTVSGYRTAARAVPAQRAPRARAARR